MHGDRGADERSFACLPAETESAKLLAQASHLVGGQPGNIHAVDEAPPERTVGGDVSDPYQFGTLPIFRCAQLPDAAGVAEIIKTTEYLCCVEDGP